MWQRSKAAGTLQQIERNLRVPGHHFSCMKVVQSGTCPESCAYCYLLTWNVDITCRGVGYWLHAGWLCGCNGQPPCGAAPRWFTRGPPEHRLVAPLDRWPRAREAAACYESRRVVGTARSAPQSILSGAPVRSRVTVERGCHATITGSSCLRRIHTIACVMQQKKDLRTMLHRRSKVFWT